MNRPLPPIVRHGLCLVAAVALVGSSLAGAPYRCQASGEVRGEPCSQDERSRPTGAMDCCSGRPEQPSAAAASACCESIRWEPAILAAPFAIDEASAAAGPAGLASPGIHPTDADALSAPVPASPQPPGDPPRLFLLHRRFLC